MDGGLLNGLGLEGVNGTIMTPMTIHNNPSGEDNNSARSSPSGGNIVTNGSNNASGYENKLFVGGLSWYAKVFLRRFIVGNECRVC